MTKTKYLFSLTVLLIVSSVTFAGVPGTIQSAMKKIYPKVSNPDWSLKNNYFVADFTADGMNKNAWFDTNGNWIMTQTDLETMDEVPGAVYNTFAFSQYASWPVNDVILAEFPKCPSVIVVKVGEFNMDVYYYLFYSLQGNLLNTYNSDYFDGTLGPEVFDCP